MKEDKLSEKLAQIKEKIEELDLPATAFAGIEIKETELSLLQTGGEQLSLQKYSLDEKGDYKKTTLSLLEERSKKENLKFLAAALSGPDLISLGSKLWLKEDIVPFVFKSGDIESLTREVEAKFDEVNLVRIDTTNENEVLASELVTLEDYKTVSSKENFDDLVKQCEFFRGKKLSFFSATPQGGGVALMRHALMRLYRLAGIDAHWYVLKERAEIFEITKTKFHNVLQSVAAEGTYLTVKDKELYNSWIEENALLFRNAFLGSDVIVIDDPQPSGLVPLIRKTNPAAKIIYRSHIHLESPIINSKGTAANVTWQFIWNNIKSSDIFVSHPIKHFVPKEVPMEKVVFAPATTDPLDGLNKELTQDQITYYIKIFNKILLEHGQIPLDLKRPYLIQIARFDPSKGLPDVLEAYKVLCGKLKEKGEQTPQLVMVGNGSIDDPDGKPTFNLISALIKDKYPELAHDIKVARLPHIDQMLNALLRSSSIVLQLSYKEGFEIKVTESLMKGKPVVAYNSGGIPLQIKDKKNGFLVRTGDTDKVAELLFSLVTDKEKYALMSKEALNNHRRDLDTVSNATRWLEISNNLIINKSETSSLKTVDFSKENELPFEGNIVSQDTTI